MSLQAYHSEVYPMTVIEALTAGIPAVLINDIIYKDVISQGKMAFNRQI